MAKPVPKTIDFNIAKAIKFIVDESHLIEIRAIKLFELQVAIASSIVPVHKQYENYEYRTGIICVPFALLASANIIASTKILELIDSRLKINHGDKYKSDYLFDDKIARSIFRRIIMTPKGLKKLRYSLRPKQFDITMKKIILLRRGVVPLYDYSIRFQTDPSYPKAKGGITNAIAKLCRVKNDSAFKVVKNYYNYISYRDKIKKDKRGRGYVAGFCWLEYFRNPYLKVQRTRTPQFATELLAKAADIDSFRYYIAQYLAVYERLTAQGYHLMKLELDSPIPNVEMLFEALPDDLVRLKPSLD